MAFFTKENPIYTALGVLVVFLIFGGVAFYEMTNASRGNPPKIFRLASWMPIAVTGIMLMFNSVARRKPWVIMFFLLIVGINAMVGYWLIPTYVVSNGDSFNDYKYDMITFISLAALCGVFSISTGLVYWKFSPYFDIVNPVLRDIGRAIDRSF